MANKLFRYGRMACIAALTFVLMPVAQAQSEQDALIAKAQTTLLNFVKDPDMTWIQKNLRRAKGVLVAPEVLKAGFIFGGSGGRGVLISHDMATDTWRGPVFYTVSTASAGFQAGVSVSENVTLIMTDKGLNTLLSPSMKLGGDASVAAGPVGASAAADVTGDFISFSRSKGLYGGLNLDGTVIAVSNDWNKTYYGKDVLPPDILIKGTVKSDKASPYVAAVRDAAK